MSVYGLEDHAATGETAHWTTRQSLDRLPKRMQAKYLTEITARVEALERREQRHEEEITALRRDVALLQRAWANPGAVPDMAIPLTPKEPPMPESTSPANPQPQDAPNGPVCHVRDSQSFVVEKARLVRARTWEIFTDSPDGTVARVTAETIGDQRVVRVMLREVLFRPTTARVVANVILTASVVAEEFAPPSSATPADEAVPGETNREA